MNYYFNPTSFGASFSVPSSIVDNCLKLATDIEIRVILFVFRHSSDGINVEEISKALAISSSEVEDALLFWTKNGLIITDAETKSDNDTPTRIVVEKNEKPTRLDVAKRGLEDEKVAAILRQAQQKFGRNLKTNESSTLVYIYDDLGFSLPLVLFLLQYALNEDKLNIRFIEKTAVAWVNSGVKNVTDAEKIISKEIKENLAWKRTEKAFGIESRKPSPKEIELSLLWFDDWGLDEAYLTLAYNVCVDAKSKFIFSYCAKTVESWHKAGLNTALEVEEYIKTNKSSKPDKNAPKYSYAGYDLDLYEKMLDSQD